MSRRARKTRLPAGPFPAYVKTLAHDGRGIAHRDGKAVFIRGALPGENITFKYTAGHSSYDEGVVEQIIQPSAERIEPRCAHFGLCGGCSLQHLEPSRQIVHKQDWLMDNLTRIGKVRPEQVLEPLVGSFWGYRRKARLGVKHVPKKGRVLVGFREQASPYVADLKHCEVLDPRVGYLLEPLAALIQTLSIYNRLPQVEVAIGDKAVALSFRVLQTPNPEDEQKLMAFGRHHDMQIYLQPGGTETTYLLWPEEASLSYRLADYDLDLSFKPFHFIQINGDVNRRTVGRALTLLDMTKNDRVLDLFCGLGNFTLPLARRAKSVVGVEGDPGLVEWAGLNAARNGVDNVRFFVADLSGEVAGQPWMSERFDKILLDPPRSGAGAMLSSIGMLGPSRVLYISCHPATLARDAGELVHRFGFKFRCAGIMDMFPHTAHVESMALFEKSSR